MEDLTGQTLDRYHLDRLLGEGGMGQVYVGTHQVTGRKVAVKLLLPELTNNKEMVDRFFREARAATAIGSEHICQVLDMRPLEEGTPYLVMELLEGETLKDHCKRLGRLPVNVAIEVIYQVLEGLHAAHTAGIVHRDIKPENVFLINRGADKAPLVKLLDFGISKFQAKGGENHSLTRTGTVLGTPYYMSPEQASGDRGVGPQSDLYAVGVMLYEVLTGSVPFDAESFSALVVKIVTEVPLHPCQRNPQLPPQLGDLVMKAMARQAQVRYGTAKEMSDALVAVARGYGIPIASVRAAEASFEAVSIPGSSGVSNLFPHTQIQPGAAGATAPYGGSGVTSPYGSSSGVSQTPMAFEQSGVGAAKPSRSWIFIAGGALAAVLLIAGVGGALLLPGMLGEGDTAVPPPPRPTVPPLNVANQPDAGTKVQSPVIPVVPPPPVDAGPTATKASDAGAAPATVTVTFEVEPRAAKVFVDDAEVPNGAITLPADGAAHTVKATARGFRDETRSFTATETKTIALELRPSGRDGTPSKTGQNGRTGPRGDDNGIVTPDGW